MSSDTSTDLLPGRPDRILLCGVARSGTRWLGSALANCAGTRLVKEPDNVDADPTKGEGGTLGIGPYPVVAAGEDAPAYGALWDLSFAARVPNQRGWRRTVARRALRLPRTLRDPLLQRTAQVMSSLPGRPEHVVVKSIYAHFALDWIIERYQPRVVVIQRHPLNVISSWSELGVHGFDLATRPAIRAGYLEPLGIEPLAQSATPLQRAAWWVGLISTVLGGAADRHPGWLLVTHEDLCADPVERIRALCARLGLAWTDAVERFLAESNRPGDGFSNVRITRDQPQRWRGRLDAGQVTEIKRVLERFPRRGWVIEPAEAVTGAM